MEGIGIGRVTVVVVEESMLVAQRGVRKKKLEESRESLRRAKHGCRL